MQLNLERGFGLLLKNNGNCSSPEIEVKLERSLKKFGEFKKRYLRLSHLLHHTKLDSVSF